jgi:hypothetical protein
MRSAPLGKQRVFRNPSQLITGRTLLLSIENRL